MSKIFQVNEESGTLTISHHSVFLMGLLLVLTLAVVFPIAWDEWLFLVLFGGVLLAIGVAISEWSSLRCDLLYRTMTHRRLTIFGVRETKYDFGDFDHVETFRIYGKGRCTKLRFVFKDPARSPLVYPRTQNMGTDEETESACDRLNTVFGTRWNRPDPRVELLDMDLSPEFRKRLETYLERKGIAPRR